MYMNSCKADRHKITIIYIYIYMYMERSQSIVKKSGQISVLRRKYLSAVKFAIFTSFLFSKLEK